MLILSALMTVTGNEDKEKTFLHINVVLNFVSLD